MRLRFYCNVHDSLWDHGRWCESAMVADGRFEAVADCKFERVALVKETSWRLRRDFTVMPLSESTKEPPL